MLGRVLSLWVCFHSDRPGFYLGTSVLIIVILFVYVVGIPASLSLGPGGEFPGFGDVLLYPFSHDELSTLLISVGLLLLVGRCQERRWGTIAFLSLSTLTMNVLPLLYTLVLSVVGGEASRISGYSAIQLALFTAQCSQLTQRRVLRCVPVCLLPWLLLLIGLLLLPGTPALLHFCSICIGHNYCQSFIRMFQELEESTLLKTIPKWVYIPVSTGFRLPNYTTSSSSRSLHQRTLLDQAAVVHMRDPSVLNHQPRLGPAPAWIIDETAAQSEAEMLEEQMLRAGLLASLQDAPDNPDAKIEVQKSSVSSLRLQQLEKMGFPTEKAVVALAATKQLDGAISLLINDSVGEQAVVVSKGKSQLPPPNT